MQKGDLLLVPDGEDIFFAEVTGDYTFSAALCSEGYPHQRKVKWLKNVSRSDLSMALRSSLKADFGIVEPRIAVLALNPHAGDGGLLGSEEEHIIRPAVNEAYEKGILAFGPFAADGFFASGHYRDYDAVLAMYHDQGLTPFKTLSPDGVNFTACLGSVRTSPDHGVAFDIAGQDKADPQSMRNAIYLATDIVNNRRAWAEWTSNPLPHAERERGGRDLSVKDLPDTEKES